MFKKLISNLPFNPSLLGTVAFYSKRLRQENSIRRMGFAFMALAMFVQIFAVVAPPQKSLAYDNDYIAPNGWTSKQEILDAWDNPFTHDTQQIYSKFGITRDEIANLSQQVTIVSTAENGNLWTTGRTSLSAVSKSGQIDPKYKQGSGSPDAEQPIYINDTLTIFARKLMAWDIVTSPNSYQAYEGIKPDGSKFWILKDCGNLTTIDVPKTTTTPINPAMEFRKTIDGGTVAPHNVGDEFTFRFEYRNSVVNSSPAENVVISDTLDTTHFDVVRTSGPATVSGNKLTFSLGSVPYIDGNFQLAGTVTVKVKAGLPNGTTICNAATLTGSNVTPVESGGTNLCVNIINPCTLDSSVPSATDKDCTTPVLVCSLTQAEVNRTTKESTLKTTVNTSNDKLTHVVSYAYDFGDHSSKTNQSTALTDTVKHVYKDGNYSATVLVSYHIGSDTKTSHVVACSADVETKPDQPLTPSKSVQNITQKLNPADSLKTKANGDDVIEYSLITHNSYDYDRANYTIADDIGDLLDYAALDTSFLSQQGGTYDSAAHTVKWEAQTVKANSDMIKKFRVTVKSPVPSTNQPSAMSTSFDCVISNKYGTEVAVPINCPPVKTAEYLTTKLPNTGPGTSILIGSFIMIVVGYFFARSRLLGKELELIRSEYATGGGF